MTQNYNDVFGVNTVPPSQYGYQAIVLTADTTFNWPSQGTANLISAIMDVSASAGLSMIMPAADDVSPGQDILIRNVGANTVTVKGSTGVTIASVAPSSVIYLYVTDNTTPAGVWGTVAFGVGTSAVDAATLMGYGIKAIGNTLNQSHPILTTGAGLTLDATHRASLVNFTGGVTTCALDQASVLGDDFFTIVRNSGTGTLTINPYGAELIDGSSTFEVQPGESLLLFCSGVSWYTVGYGRSVIYNFTQLVLDVSAGGTFTLTPTEASNKLLTFIGNPAAGVTVVVPSVVAVYYLLSQLSTAQTVTVKTALGTGVAVPQGQRIVAICDSTNVYSAQSVSASTSISLIDGSVSTPSLNFASKTNTGLYKYSTAGLGIAINGVDVAHVDTTGTTFNGTSPIVSAKAGPTTGQQHTIPAVSSDTFTLNAATQTLTNKTIVAANNTITTAASGGLVATELNAALAELEAEIVLKQDAATAVQKTSNTGIALLPSGTTAQRDGSPTVGGMRFSTTLLGWEGWNGVNWTSIGGGQMYGQALVKGIFYNNTNISENITVLAGTNGGTFGPVIVDSGFTVTVESGSVWSIV